ncbi:MarR family transcriptional regulator [Paraclostridium bifermentans]|uniref:MarR family winged helix-turn-helix transcriptional regulator n=1 Tax=Paraclostridium bifermentans TaxID=1490 RepID=UPI001C113A94|nr:MarR family transcriptional regulator [Paraclostridium bifermentans]MBU5287000.1 MarR family transcriptional regulator [Paraclostridium bifermentans]
MINKEKLKLGLDISKINHIISRKMDTSVISAIDDNLTISQAYVIDFICNEGKDKDVFQKDLESVFDLKRSSISLMLNNMEKNGLIEKMLVKEDGRLKKIVLTEKSIKIYEKISDAIDLIENKLSENITEEEVKVFQNVLNKIRNSLE